MEMLTHLNKRLRADEAVKLPVADLLALVQSSKDTVTLVRFLQHLIFIITRIF